jgi:hypothetical protein
MSILECIGVKGIYNFEDLETMLDCEIYDEERGKSYRTNKVGIYFYHGRHPPIIDIPIKVQTITKLIKTGRLLKEGERDIHIIPSIVNYVNEYNQLLASIDIKGNLVFCDFQHYGNKFYEFWDIINDWINIRREGIINLVASEIMSEFVNSIRNYAPIKIYEIKCEFDKEKFIEEAKQKILEIKNNFETFYKIKEEQLMEIIQEFQERLKTEKEDGIRIGMKIIGEISKEFAVSIKDNHLVIKVDIIPNRVKNDNTIMNIPTSEDKSEFFIKNLHIELSPILNRVYAEKAFHPNVDEMTRKVCIGDLEGEELNVDNIKKMVEMLKVMNFDSAFPNRATSRLYEIIKEIKEEGDRNVWFNE